MKKHNYAYSFFMGIKSIKFINSRLLSFDFAIKAVIIMALCWIGLHSPFRAISSGLDGSWQFGINALGSHGLRYGEDILFTYGPLGHILVPLPIDAHILQAVIVHLGLLLILCGLLVYASLRWLTLPRLLIVGLLWLFVLPSAEIQPLLIVAMLAALLAGGRRQEALVCVVPACLLALATAFAKFSLGFATIGSVIAALIIRSFSDRESARNLWLLASLSACLFVAAITYWGFGSTGALLRWIRGGIELSSGYSSAMSSGGGQW